MQELRENLHLLNEKLLRPRLPDVFVPRDALMKRLDARGADKRIVILHAPAGCGKTVSASLWLQASGRRAVWISLDAYDNVPSVFFRQFCVAMISAQEGASAPEELLRGGAFSSAPVEHTIRFLSELQVGGLPTALVLDDMHNITNPELLKALPLVLKRLPLSYLTVILSRRELEPPFASQLTDGRIANISADRLAFSPDEIKKLFGAHGHFITQGESEEILDATGGWAISVRALASGGMLQPVKIFQTLSDYIREQLWEQWPARLREFMLRTAIADTVELELCALLTGCDDVEGTLETLCAINPFVSRIDGMGFRYHHLFLDFLRSRWAVEEVPLGELNKLASLYYCDRGDYFTARRFAIASGDIETVSAVAHRSIQYTNLSLDEYVSFWKACGKDSLPEEICEQHPFLYSSLVWLYYISGDADRVLYYLDRLSRGLPLIASRYPQFLENSLLILHLDFRVSFREQVRQFSLMPVPKVRHSAPQAMTLTLQMPLLHRSNRDYSELIDPELMKGARVTFGAFLKESCPVALRCVASGLLLEQGRIREAADQIRQDQPGSLMDLPAEIAFSLCAHHAAVEIASGGDWQSWLRHMERVITENDAHFLQPNFCAFRTRIRLLDGDGEAAREWLEQYFVGECEWPELHKLYQHLTTARAYILRGFSDRALELLKKLRAMTAGFRRTLDWAEACVLIVALDWAAGRREEALDGLEKVLAALQPGCFVTVIAAEGAVILPALRHLAVRSKRDGGAGDLDSAFLHEIIIAATRYTKRHRGIADGLRRGSVHLSRRQVEILELRAKGLRNQEIAERLALSLHTVKAHLAAAYEKLEVNRCVDALVRARELDLLG